MKNEPFIGSGLIKGVNKSVASKCSKELNRTPASSASVDLSNGGDGERKVAAWFLGPRAENLDIFLKLVEEAITDHAYWRRNFHPEDPTVITESIQREAGYLDAMDRTKSELFKLLAQLKGSAPFSSMRYQGHMCWDQTIPGMVGYVAAMLYNQNNTATEASPVTTVLEYLVGQDLCKMCGYRTQEDGDVQDGEILAWGHLTCGGTTANIEAMWAARNAKYYPVAIKKAVESGNLPGSEALMVTLPNGTTTKKITELNSWELLNLTLDETLALPKEVINLMKNPELTEKEAQQLLEENTADYQIQNIGLLGLYTDDLLPPPVDGKPIQPPVFFVPASKHYSFPKGAAILGVGGNNLRSIPLDKSGRMDTVELKNKLQECNEKREPVIGVTAVFGTTEEGNVDSLENILATRATMHAEGLDFAVHVDGAWGAYFASMISLENPAPPDSGPVPVLPMSTYVETQYRRLAEADTITIDPHKTGYLPYPAGALCYRNKLMRSMVAFSAPYTNTGSSDDTADDPCRPDTGPDYPEDDLVMGVYGIEGSKPGAAAAGVYLSHAVIPTDPSGYGTLLGRTLFNCKIFHFALLCLNDVNANFYVVPVPHTQFGNGSVTGEVARTVLKSQCEKNYEEFISQPDAMELLKENGADLNIICFAFNFKDAGGIWNTSLDKANEFNKAIFDRCGVKLYDNIHDYRFVTSATSFPKSGYGEVFFNDYAGRLLNEKDTTLWGDADSISVMRSVIMDPWLAENRDGEPFLKDVVAELGSIVCEVVRDMGYGIWPPK
jgi:glutamate/tyrosine decarboxylase-like PLP-dependent enzyme